MDYSIIIPVFNKADLTKRCLDVLPSTITDAGVGEVIVVDNASSDHTQSVLAAYPWIRVIRNEKNVGFAAANNQAAKIASGKYLVLLNNDTEAWPSWLASMLRIAADPGVGAVGARLLFPNKTSQHGGVVVVGGPFGRQKGMPYHHNYVVPFGTPDVERTQDFQIVTGACLVTPRALYEELGGLDQLYWNGYEDVDYCLKVGERGLRVVYDGGAVLYHFESQSGIQRFRRTAWNTRVLDGRWRGTLRYDALLKTLQSGLLRYPIRGVRLNAQGVIIKTPATDVIVHGADPRDGRAAFERALRANHAPVRNVVWATGPDALELARETMRVRGLRYVAFVDGGSTVYEGWLDELLRQATSTASTGASTYSQALPLDENVATLAGDGRCTLLSLFTIPQHMQLEPFDTLCGSLGDLLLRLVPHGFGTRGAARRIAELPPLADDAAFAAKYGRTLAELSDTDPLRIEEILSIKPKRERPLVSIVTLSWNAPEYTRIALDSIAKYTNGPYEVIVVDNGSGPETLQMLKAIDDPHVHVIYNETNRGFSGGNNDGIAHASGEYIVVLNNDVIVTEGWLDGLLDPFERMPNVGVTAPRSNKIAGDQQVVASYTNIDEIQAFARERASRFAKRGYLTDRAIGFCLCIDRRVIEQIGGFDERFGKGNFEDDDLCIRVRGAGYDIYVCDDVFIHHFGSQSFIANKVDYSASLSENWRKFAEKWKYAPDRFPDQGYDPRSAICGGFDRHVHYAPLPAKRVQSGVPVQPLEHGEGREIVFAAAVDSERAWSEAAEFTRRYFQAFDGRRDVALLIAATGDLAADVLGRRVRRTLEKLGLAEERCADVDISDEADMNSWRTAISARVVIDIDTIEDRSPSSLRRLVEGLPA